VPTAGSNAFPEEWRAGADVLAARLGLVVPGAVDTGAVDLLIRTAHGSARPVRLLAIGPLTNVALAFDRDPAIADHLADIVVMGGAVDVEGTVEPHYRAEWNIWADPAAADRVLRSGVPITLVPLDATNAVPASVFFHEALAEQMSTPEAELVYEFFATHPFNLEGGAYFFWDVLAAAAMVEPDVATYRGHRIAVVETSGVDQGATVESPAGAEVLVAVGADRGRFEAEFLSTLNGEVPAAVSVPEPDLSVRYDEASCALEAPTDMVADGPAATVVVEFANASVGTAAAVFGLHPGVDLEEVVADAARGDELTEPPPYWQETGLVVAFGAPLTGGSVIGRVELEPGVHAVVCVGEDDRPVVAGDVRVEASAS
jgi:inosine-uridine nucleoside N-ribohydrolase